MSGNVNNMKQAVFELFGVGSGAEISVVPAQIELINEDTTPEVVAPPPTPVVERVSRVSMSYIAAGTVLEGTLRAEGDVEMAGELKGDIDAKGSVTLFSSMEGNVCANNLTLTNCTLTGNATISDTLVIGEKAEIQGNIIAKEVRCAGQICGDMTVSGNAALERTAQVRGNIVTGSFSVAKGATICGGLEIKGR